ncbi:hypothetical protein IWW34DRAFT_873831 [Fusarium oxysporum f. sp. albedinis]|nr:hypothetical protein FocnCong_v021030 [Fusarium oxysporum f. sp. conglutinans]KAI3571862.1 hypothetical protein IWW34DRAFT_873831 [Fusarium oxysporum f. sp. albedinis]
MARLPLSRARITTIVNNFTVAMNSKSQAASCCLDDRQIEHEFGTLYDTFPTESRVFENRNFLAGFGNRISQRPIADEKTLEYFLHNIVEDPVRAIIQQLKQVEEVSRAFRIGDGVVFENHPHALSDVSEEVVDRETPLIPPRTPDHRRDLKQLRPDQICVYRSDNTLSSRRTMVYVSEYKPPHKLTAPHLRLGLRAMDIHKEVVNRRTIPTSVDPDARFQYHAEKLTASAITQTYHYMIDSGLEYGLLTTGEAIMFLKVDWDEPETVLSPSRAWSGGVGTSKQPPYMHGRRSISRVHPYGSRFAWRTTGELAGGTSKSYEGLEDVG